MHGLADLVRIGDPAGVNGAEQRVTRGPGIGTSERTVAEQYSPVRADGKPGF